MNDLTTIRNAIKTRLAALTVANGYAFTLASTNIVSVFDDPEQLAESLFPRAYVFTPPDNEITIERQDIGQTVNAMSAPINVNLWRKLGIGDDISALADATAAAAIKVIATDTAWANNPDTLLLKSVKYHYLDLGGDTLMVELRYEAAFEFNQQAP